MVVALGGREQRGARCCGGVAVWCCWQYVGAGGGADGDCGACLCGGTLAGGYGRLWRRVEASSGFVVVMWRGGVGWRGAPANGGEPVECGGRACRCVHVE